jgi:hypothetical protein
MFSLSLRVAYFIAVADLRSSAVRNVGKPQQLIHLQSCDSWVGASSDAPRRLDMRGNTAHCTEPT